MRRTMPHRRPVAARMLAACLFLGSAGIAAGAEPPATAPAPIDSLAELNAEFLASYARSRAEMLRRSGPVILFDGEKLVLLRNGERREGTPVAAAYDHLKAVAHLQLAVFVELVNEPDGALSDSARARLKTMRERIAAVERDWVRIDFGTGDREVQRRLVMTAARFIDGVLESGTVDRASLVAFAAAAKPDIDRNADVTAALELKHYQTQVEAWRKDLSDDEWRRTRVVVIGAQMPRRDNRVVQLFAALLGVAGEGERIVYAEGLFEEQRALNLLGTHLLDGEASQAFFGDPSRLSRDLLSDGAAKYVRENFAKPQ